MRRNSSGSEPKDTQDDGMEEEKKQTSTSDTESTTQTSGTTTGASMPPPPPVQGNASFATDLHELANGGAVNANMLTALMMSGGATGAMDAQSVSHLQSFMNQVQQAQQQQQTPSQAQASMMWGGGGGGGGGGGMYGGYDPYSGGAVSVTNSSSMRGLLEGLNDHSSPDRQLVSLNQLNEALSLASEDSMNHFSVDSFVPPLVQLLDSNFNSEIMLLAARALTNLMDVMPSSINSIVHRNAIPALCNKLLSIEYIDVAEQCILALEKIAYEHAGAIAAAGGLMAILSYIDFFGMSTQRVASSIVANVCRMASYSEDAKTAVLNSVELVANLLSSSDAKVVSNACYSFARLVEVFAGDEGKLLQVVGDRVITAALQLISPNEASVELEGNAYVNVIHMLTSMCRHSPVLCARLLEAGLCDVLKQVASTSAAEEAVGSAAATDTSTDDAAGMDMDDSMMSTTSTSSSSSSSSSTSTASAMGTPSKMDTSTSGIGNSPKHLFDMLQLMYELLPPLPKEMAEVLVQQGGPGGHYGNTGMPYGSYPGMVNPNNAGAQAGASQDDPKEHPKTKMYADAPALLETVGGALLQPLMDLFRSTVITAVTHKCLSIIEQILYFSSAEVLTELLRNLPVSSFLASLIESNARDTALVLAGLQIAELLITKMPNIFRLHFFREGVVFEIAKLAAEAEEAGMHGDGSNGDDDEEDPMMTKARKDMPLCTYGVFVNSYIAQNVYECHSCGINGGRVVCEPCFLKCHRGHEVSARRYSSNSYCDCGPSGNCKCMSGHREMMQRYSVGNMAALRHAYQETLDEYIRHPIVPPVMSKEHQDRVQRMRIVNLALKFKKAHFGKDMDTVDSVDQLMSLDQEQQQSSSSNNNNDVSLQDQPFRVAVELRGLAQRLLRCESKDELDAVLSRLAAMVGDVETGVTAFELLHSRMAGALLHTLCATSKSHALSQDTRVRAFVRHFGQQRVDEQMREEAMAPALAHLVRLLQGVLSKSEQFELSMYDQTSTSMWALSQGMRLLSAPLRVLLQPAEGETQVRELGQPNATVEPIARMQAIIDNLEERLELVPRSRQAQAADRQGKSLLELEAERLEYMAEMEQHGGDPSEYWDYMQHKMTSGASASPKDTHNDGWGSEQVKQQKKSLVKVADDNDNDDDDDEVDGEEEEEEEGEEEEGEAAEDTWESYAHQDQDTWYNQYYADDYGDYGGYAQARRAEEESMMQVQAQAAQTRLEELEQQAQEVASMLTMVEEGEFDEMTREEMRAAIMPQMTELEVMIDEVKQVALQSQQQMAAVKAHAEARRQKARQSKIVSKKKRRVRKTEALEKSQKEFAERGDLLIKTPKYQALTQEIMTSFGGAGSLEGLEGTLDAETLEAMKAMWSAESFSVASGGEAQKEDLQEIAAEGTYKGQTKRASGTKSKRKSKGERKASARVDQAVVYNTGYAPMQGQMITNSRGNGKGRQAVDEVLSTEEVVGKDGMETEEGGSTNRNSEADRSTTSTTTTSTTTTTTTTTTATTADSTGGSNDSEHGTPKPRKQLELLFNGHVLDADMTLFQAIHLYGPKELTDPEARKSTGTPAGYGFDMGNGYQRTLWENTYTLEYRVKDTTHGDGSSSSSSSSSDAGWRVKYATKPTTLFTEADMHLAQVGDRTTDFLLHQNTQEQQSDAEGSDVQGSMSSSENEMEVDVSASSSSASSSSSSSASSSSASSVSTSANESETQCMEALCLLRVLELINRQGVDRQEQIISSFEFHNNKLSVKLTRQLQDMLTLAARGLPTWTKRLTLATPFLFPFETRRLYLQCTGMGASRAMHALGSVTSGATRVSDVFGAARIPRQKVRIRRDDLLNSAIRVLELYGTSYAVLEVEYFGEVGVGLGPTLEFFSTVSRQLMRKDLALWMDTSNDTVDNGTTGVTPNDTAGMDVDGEGGKQQQSTQQGFIQVNQGLFPRPWPEVHETQQARTLRLFEFAGAFVAKSLVDGRLLDLPFARPFYKALLGETLHLTDLLHINEAFGRSMLKMQAVREEYERVARESAELEESQRKEALEAVKLDGVAIDMLGLDFTVPGHSEIELKAGGKDVCVDVHNLGEYLDLVGAYYLSRGCERQIAAFRRGFSNVMHVDRLRIFSAAELETLLYGDNTKWSMAMLMEHTKVEHGYSHASRVVQLLFEVLCEFDIEQQRQFLRFLTGSPSMPVGGLANLNPRFTIVRKGADWPDDYLPSVMTCQSFLKLPEYTSKEVLKNKLLFAMAEGQESFHLS